MVLLFRGLTSRIKVINPAKNGNIIMMNTLIGPNPIMLKSFGLAENCEKTDGFEKDFINIERSKGIAPTVFAAIRITANINIYLQKPFLPLNVDSR
jgi:hypothetical protein